MISDFLLALFWYGALTLLAIVFAPIVLVLFSHLADRGWSILRPVTLVLTVLPLWWLSSIINIPFTTAGILLMTGMLGVVIWIVALAFAHDRLLGHLPLRRILILELISFTGFMGYVAFRGFNPAIRSTEKPMELMYLSASTLTEQIPMLDPWLAGETTNYYYFGYLLFGTLGRLTGIAPEYAFNLGLATVFSLSIVAIAGLVSTALQRSDFPQTAQALAAALAVYLFAFAGNLYTFIELLKNPGEVLGTSFWWSGIGWQASRIISDTTLNGPSTLITEFPAFSFVLGDLHPHLMSVVIFVPVLYCAFSIVTTSRSIPALSAVAGMLVGVSYMTNTWDMPVLALITATAIVFRHRHGNFIRAASSLVVSGLVAVVAVLPYLLEYETPRVESDSQADTIPIIGSVLEMFAFVSWDRTSAGEHAIVLGPFVLLAIAVAAGLWYRRVINAEPADQLPILMVMGAALALPIAALFLATPAFVIIGIPFVLILASIASPPFRLDVLSYALGLVAIALLVVLGLEFVYFRDIFQSRMNTVFKMYIHVWILLTIGLSTALPFALRIARRAHRHFATGLFAMTTLVVLATSVYTPISAWHWTEGFDQWKGVNGLAYLQESNPGEVAAIEWIRSNVGAEQVVLEAPGCVYGMDSGVPHNRVSAATGRPTIIGWRGHERVWRLGTIAHSDLLARQDAATAIYQAENSAEELIDTYAVEFIYVGVLERDGFEGDCASGPPYGEDTVARLVEEGWQLAFESGEVTILSRQ